MAAFSLAQRGSDLTQQLERLAASRWTPLAASLLALALLSWSLAQWSWRLLTPPSAPPPPAPVTTVVDNASAMRDLLAAHLFGQADPGNGLSAGQLPQTSLNLTLTGVMVRGADSYALIRIEGGDETPITVGQDVQPGVKLQAVHPDRAVLLRAGILESLPLKDAVPALPEGSIVTGAAVRRQATTFGIEQADDNQFLVNRDSVLKQMQRPEFLTQALIVPNSGGGFLVREVQPGSVYEKLGVRVGDVIRSVNGQPVNNMDDVMKIYQQLGGLHRAGNVNLEVARAGRVESLQYNLK